MRNRWVMFVVGLSMLAFILGSRSIGQTTRLSPDIPLTVSDWANINRESEPVTSGVPIPSLATGASWALFDGVTEIPLQTTVLSGSKTPWLLLDFQTTIATPGNSKNLTLKQQTPTATPAQSLINSEDANQITVTTGPIKTQLSKTTFNLFDTVWFDSNTDGSFDIGEEVVTPGAGNLTINDVAVPNGGTGLVYSAVVSPTTGFTWEYQGPLRRTLLVDGSYQNPASSLANHTLLDFTTRITWYAGKTFVKIDHVIRNSSPTQEQYVKLTSAKLNAGTTTTTNRIAKSGDIVWSNVLAGIGASVQLIPPTLDISPGYDPYATPPVWRSNITIDVDANGGLIIGDLSYHGATVQLDFADNLKPIEQGRRATVAKDALIARAPESWYSDLSALGEHFSTYQDEKNANIKWGWTWPTPGNQWSEEHNLPRRQNIYASWSVLDGANDPESDDLHENIVMLMRTGLPYYLDRSKSWARYLKWEGYFRTDGYPYAGAWDNFWDGPGTVDRPVVEPTLQANDSDYIDHDMKFGKVTADHIWNGGLFEYYYLTGDRDALNAAIDTAEQCKRYFDWQYLPLHGIGGNARGPGRCLLILLQTWQVTGDQQWKTSADHIQTFFLQSSRYDARGFYYNDLCETPSSDVCQRFPNGKHFSGFQIAAGTEGLYQYFVLTNDQATKNRILDVATFIRDNIYDPVTGFGGDENIVDWPAPGNVSRVTTSQFRNLPPIYTISAAASSRDFINVLIMGYRLTGDNSFLHRAKTAWSRASKGDPSNIIATDTQVGGWANSLQAWGPDGLLFRNGGDWSYVSYLFYEAAWEDDMSPARVNDLQAS